MIAAGYMSKRVSKRTDWLKAINVVDIFSVSGCVSHDFTDYIDYWKHNGYWLFDSPEIIENVAREHSIALDGTDLFFYEVYEKEFDGQNWSLYEPDASFPTNVVPPLEKTLEGFDVVTFFAKNAPECSPLSCNGMAEELRTNEHCLLASFDDAHSNVSSGLFNNSEPGPYRIFAVYSINWTHG